MPQPTIRAYTETDSWATPHEEGLTPDLNTQLLLGSLASGGLSSLVKALGGVSSKFGNFPKGLSKALERKYKLPYYEEQATMPKNVKEITDPNFLAGESLPESPYDFIYHRTIHENPVWNPNAMRMRYLRREGYDPTEELGDVLLDLEQFKPVLANRYTNYAGRYNPKEAYMRAWGDVHSMEKEGTLDKALGRLMRPRSN